MNFYFLAAPQNPNLVEEQEQTGVTRFLDSEELRKNCMRMVFISTAFVYIVALIDVYSRFVVGWPISNTLETSFCIEALKLGLEFGLPEVVNSDQGSQFTSEDWVDFLKDNAIQISMTRKGRCLDNVYIERFWRSVKREEFYLNEYKTIKDLKLKIGEYIEFYNYRRWHQSLAYKTPAQVYFIGSWSRHWGNYTPDEFQ